MRKSLKNKLSAIAFLAFAAAVGAGFAALPSDGTAEIASAESPTAIAAESGEFYVEESASVRINADSSGIRFATKVSEAWFDGLKEAYPDAELEFHTLIYKAVDDIETVTPETPDVEDRTFEGELQFVDGYATYYNAVIYDNLDAQYKQAAYALDLCARSYVKIAGEEAPLEYAYAGNFARSIRAVANMALITDETLSAEQTEILEGFLGNVTPLGSLGIYTGEETVAASLPDGTYDVYVNAEKVNSDVAVSGGKIDLSGFAATAAPGEYALSFFDETNNVWRTDFVLPKVITEAEELLSLREYCETGETVDGVTPYTGTILLGANIDLGENVIGEDGYRFAGTFDGQGYTISGGVYLSGGLFGGGVSDGTVKNVAFEDVTVQYSNLLYGNSRVDTLFGRLEGATLENVYVNVTGARESGQADTQMSFVVFANVIENSTLKNVIVKSVKTWVDRNLFAGSIYAGSTKFENVYVLGELTSSQYNADTWEQYPDYNTYAGLTQLSHEATWSDVAGAEAFADACWNKKGAVGFASWALNVSVVFDKYAEGTSGKNTADLEISVFADGEYNVAIDGESRGTAVAADKKLSLPNAELMALQCGEHSVILSGPSYREIDLRIDSTATLTTAEEFLAWRDYCDAGEPVDGVTTYTGTILLGADIDLSGVTADNAIGANDSRFAGIFDGQGYTVSGGVYQLGGLFRGGISGGTVKNVAFEDVTMGYSNFIYGNYTVMSLFGRLNNATLENVYVNVTQRHQFGSEDQLAYVVLAESLTNSSLTNVIVKAGSSWVDRNLFVIDIDAETDFENVYMLGDEKFYASYGRETANKNSFDMYEGITKLAYEATWSDIAGADAFPDTYWDKTGAVGFKKKDAA